MSSTLAARPLLIATDTLTLRYCEIARSLRLGSQFTHPEEPDLDPNHRPSSRQIARIFHESRGTLLPIVAREFPMPTLHDDNEMLPRSEQLFMAAKACCQRGDIQGAINRYHNVISIDSNHVGAYYGLGVLFKVAGRYFLSLSHLREVKNREPDYPNLKNKFLEIGQTLADQGYIEDAIFAFKDAIDCDPNFVRAWLNLGDAYRDIHDYKNAEQAYQQAEELDPGNSIALSKLCALYYHLGHIYSLESAYLVFDSYHPDLAIGVKPQVDQLKAEIAKNTSQVLD